MKPEKQKEAFSFRGRKDSVTSLRSSFRLHIWRSTNSEPTTHSTRKPGDIYIFLFQNGIGLSHCRVEDGICRRYNPQTPRSCSHEIPWVAVSTNLPFSHEHLKKKQYLITGALGETENFLDILFCTVVERCNKISILLDLYF